MTDNPPSLSESFEGKDCPKCVGTGLYAGRLDCFACYGGRILTDRGRNAWAMYLSLLRKPAREFEPGDLLYWRSPPAEVGGVWGPVQFFPVLAIAPDDSAAVPDFLTFRLLFGPISLWAEASCRFGATSEYKQAARRHALAYQSRLDKNGKDSERKGSKNVPRNDDSPILLPSYG